jgi:hypothetical protein
MGSLMLVTSSVWWANILVMRALNSTPFLAVPVSAAMRASWLRKTSGGYHADSGKIGRIRAGKLIQTTGQHTQGAGTPVAAWKPWFSYGHMIHLK